MSLERAEFKAGVVPIQSQDWSSPCKIINVTETGNPVGLSTEDCYKWKVAKSAPYNQQGNALPAFSEFFKKSDNKAPWVADVLSTTKKPRQ